MRAKTIETRGICVGSTNRNKFTRGCVSTKMNTVLYSINGNITIVLGGRGILSKTFSLDPRGYHILILALVLYVTPRAVCVYSAVSDR